MDLSSVVTNGVLVVPFITAIVELVKGLGLNAKYCPIVSVVLGAILGIAYVEPTNIMSGLIIGISLGLSSSGLYDNVSTFIKK